ncbi:hypothetical protein FPSE5266_11467 [Fusarium pseudograminearum]|nr:hypothetical protein FPSE5266_11467 [Fusarium pseudograminearum]
MSETKDLSSQVQDTTKDTASNEQQSSVNYDQSVPRSGVVNDAGDILDDAGKTVGKVADTDNLKNLVGNTVNSAGDVVDSSGDVLGKTLPIGQGKPEEEEDSHDEEKSEYTTQSKDKKSGGLGDAVGSVTSAVGDTAKSATDTVGETTKGATDAVGDTAKGATDTAGDVTDDVAAKSEATSHATDTKTPAETPKAPGVKEETPDVKDEASDVKDNAPDVKENAPEVKDETSDVKDETTDQTDKINLEDREAPADADDKLKEVAPEPEEAKETTKDVSNEAKDIPEKAKDASEEAKDVPEEAKDVPEEAKEDVTSKVDEQEQDVPKPEEVEEKLQEKTEGAKDEATKSEVPEGDVGKTEAPVDEVPSGEVADDDKSKTAGDDLKSVAPGEDAAGVTDEVQSKAAQGEDAAQDKVSEADKAAEDVPEDVKSKTAEADKAAEDLPEDAQSKAADGEKAVEDLPEDAKDKVEDGEKAAEELPEDAQSKAPEDEQVAGDVADEAKDKAAETEEAVDEKTAEAEEPAKEPLDFSVLKGTTVDKEGNLVNDKGDKIGKIVEGELKQLVGLSCDDQGQIWDKTGKQLGKAEPIPEWDREQKDSSILKGTTVDKEGNLVNDKGHLIGRVIEGEIKQLVGLSSDDQGVIWDRTGKQVGKAEPLPEWERGEQKDYSLLKGKTVDKNGNLVDEKGHLFGKVVEGEIKQLIGLSSDDQGTIWDKTGKAAGKAEPLPEWERGEQKDFSILKGAIVDKEGGLTSDKGDTIGKVTEGEIKQLVGLKSDENGKIWRDGKVVGQAEPLPEWERVQKKDRSILKGAVVDKEGGLTNDKGDTIGKVVEGEVRQLVGLKSDENGKIWRDGNVVGQADPLEEWDRVQKKDRSVLKGSKVNKVGKLVDSNGNIVGKVVEGDLKELLGKRSDENGDIWNDSGEVIGKGEPVSASEREQKSSAPFENFPDAIVESDGRVMYNGEQVGEVIEGNPKELKGSKVDEDGDILDRRGNSVGKAKRWEAPEAEEEKPVDNSALAGKRVNKAGNLVSESGEIYGRVIEGNVQKLVGRMSDRDGNIRSESGDIIGKAELVSEGERGGKKDGPFAELKNCTVAKDGKVVNQAGETVGRLVIGDAKALVGRSVDDDGEIVDSNGNVIGKAERWEEPEKEKSHNPLAGRKVNREGNVVDADGNIIGKLTSGEILDCQGKEVDEDGDVFNQKGSVVGHVSLLEDIPKEPEEEPTPEPEGETEEERIKREQAEADIKAEQDEAEKNKKLAQQLAYQIEQTLERLRPICKSISDKISAAEAQKPEDRDEEELVRQVKPLIEDGGKLLTETNGIIRGLDPDGRIARNAKQKSSSGEATPEEAHLANLLKELSTEIQTCIDEGKRKLEGMPHAKKEINPLWGLLAEPLFQIVAAVGLLLSGVLGLVGKLLGPILGPLLNGLGLGGLLDGLLGGLGLKKILGSLGLGDVVGTVTGKK